jgi:hypothetical protein
MLKASDTDHGLRQGVAGQLGQTRAARQSGVLKVLVALVRGAINREIFYKGGMGKMDSIMSEIKRFMAPGPWITRDLKLCVLASDYDQLLSDGAGVANYALGLEDEISLLKSAMRRVAFELEESPDSGNAAARNRKALEIAKRYLASQSQSASDREVNSTKGKST